MQGQLDHDDVRQELSRLFDPLTVTAALGDHQPEQTLRRHHKAAVNEKISSILGMIRMAGSRVEDYMQRNVRGSFCVYNMHLFCDAQMLHRCCLLVHCL